MIKEKATPHIGLVTDLTTGQIDGKITPGGMVLVTGCNIKIENGNKPVCEAINSPTKMEKLAASTHRSK